MHSGERPTGARSDHALHPWDREGHGMGQMNQRGDGDRD